jgi:hypothetical protein
MKRKTMGWNHKNANKINKNPIDGLIFGGIVLD